MVSANRNSILHEAIATITQNNGSSFLAGGSWCWHWSMPHCTLPSHQHCIIARSAALRQSRRVFLSAPQFKPSPSPKFLGGQKAHASCQLLPLHWPEWRAYGGPVFSSQRFALGRTGFRVGPMPRSSTDIRDRPVPMPRR